MNSPIPKDLASECRKAAKIMEAFVKPEKSTGGLDQVIPPWVITNAKGVAILTVIKAGFLFTGRAGSGLVVARADDGGWSAPSAIFTTGMGVGGQIGAELTDFVIFLNTRDAVKAFGHGGNVTLGGNLSVAAGPLGRNAEAAGTVGNFAAIYSYSKTRGLFAGISIEGTVILERKEANANFYHRKVGAMELLSGTVPPPPAAEDLYRALNRRVEAGALYVTDGGGTLWPEESSGGAGFGRFNGKNRDDGRDTYDQRTSDPYDRNDRRTTDAHEDRNNGSFGRATTTKTSPKIPRAGPPPPPPPNRSNQIRAIALYDFEGEQDGDLSFRKGDIIVVLKKTTSQNDWWTGRCAGREGQFPANYVEIQ
ncbi:hypothetical protein BJ742DRAFT_677130 [Cladochytrium replicatum]|nr:hypothetical protein BJ742DRAFT_677130 [Cladochytrium replicatum]